MGVILVPVCKIECWGLWYFFFVPPSTEQNGALIYFFNLSLPLPSTFFSLFSL